MEEPTRVHTLAPRSELCHVLFCGEWIDFCPYGICIDYFADQQVSIDELTVNEKYRAVKLFPYGILVDDLFRVHVEMHIPELAEAGVMG